MNTFRILSPSLRHVVDYMIFLMSYLAFIQLVCSVYHVLLPSENVRRLEMSFMRLLVDEQPSRATFPSRVDYLGVTKPILAVNHIVNLAVKSDYTD